MVPLTPSKQLAFEQQQPFFGTVCLQVLFRQ